MTSTTEFLSLSHEVVPTPGLETPHVKRVEIGFLPQVRDKLEQVAAQNEVSAEFLKEALAGTTFHCSLEHIPRLVHDQITIGRDSYSAQSWRYVKMHFSEGDLTRVHPSGEVEKAGLLEEYTQLAAASINAYDRMRELGIPAEDARFAFLWSFDSNMVMTLQGPKIVDFAIQNLNSPYDDVRFLANEVLQNFGQEFPVTVEKLRGVAALEGIKMRERNLLAEIREPLYSSEKGDVFAWMLKDPKSSAAVAARTCYQEGTPSEFVGNFSVQKQNDIIHKTMKDGHTSIAEHPHFLVEFMMSETGIQQLRRHRIPVQRAKDMWLAAEGDYPIVIPPTVQVIPEAADLMEQVRQNSIAFRKLAIKKGVPLPELDGSVMVGINLPAFLVTNATDAIHIGNRRLCNKAQWEIRAWMYRLADALVSSAPDLFEKLGPGCFTGKCTEGERSCGRPQDYREWWNQTVWLNSEGK